MAMSVPQAPTPRNIPRLCVECFQWWEPGSGIPFDIKFTLPRHSQTTKDHTDWDKEIFLGPSRVPSVIVNPQPSPSPPDVLLLDPV